MALTLVEALNVSFLLSCFNCLSPLQLIPHTTAQLSMCKAQLCTLCLGHQLSLCSPYKIHASWPLVIWSWPTFEHPLWSTPHNKNTVVPILWTYPVLFWFCFKCLSHFYTSKSHTFLKACVNPSLSIPAN